MVQFLEVMHKISFTRNKEQLSKELIMTQYMLKLLTILSNILVSNMQVLDAARTETYVQTLASALKVSLQKVNSVRPLDSDRHEAFFVGCSLLKELAFAFMDYVIEEVKEAELSRLLKFEYI